jgi:hypothetical protein
VAVRRLETNVSGAGGNEISGAAYYYDLTVRRYDGVNDVCLSR